MTSSGRMLVAGSALSQLGNFVNVTAVMVVLQAEHGASVVAAYFLVRSALPFILARPLVALVPPFRAGTAWASAQVILAGALLVLALWPDQLALLLGLLAAAGVLQSCSSAWIMQIGQASDPGNQAGMITALSTSISVALVAGPALGGVLVGVGGLRLVLILDAASFAASVALVPWSRAPAMEVRPPAEQVRTLRGAMAHAFNLRHGRWHSAPFRNLTVLWVAFGLFGGFLTACETPVFRDLKGFSSDQIGFAIACYGVGGLAVFIGSTFFGLGSRRLATSIVMAAGALAWFVAGGWVVYLSFFVVGLGYSLLDSAVQVAFGEVFASEPGHVGQSWAWLNQLSMLTSVVSFLAAFVYFSATPDLVPITVLTALFAGICVVLALRGDAQLRAAGPDA